LITQNFRRQFSSVTFLDRTKQLLDEATQNAKKTEQVSKSWLAKENDEKMPAGGFYKHPYCTDEHPLALNSDHILRDAMRLVGPEQVSPHYDSIEEFGKYFNYFFLFGGFLVCMRSHHNHAFGFVVLDMMFGLELWVYTLSMYILRCSMIVIPNPWKMLWIKYNMEQICNSVYEIEENLASERKKPSIQQYDYLRLHKEFAGTKAQLLDKHL